MAKKDELIEWLLQFLYKKPNSYYDVRALFKQVHKIEDRGLVASVLKDLYKINWLTRSADTEFRVCLNYEGRQAVEKYGDYFSYLRIERRRNRFINWSTKLSTVSTIMAIIVTPTALMLGVLNYRLDKTKHLLENENQELKERLDSINTNKPLLQILKKDN